MLDGSTNYSEIKMTKIYHKMVNLAERREYKLTGDQKADVCQDFWEKEPSPLIFPQDIRDSLLLRQAGAQYRARFLLPNGRAWRCWW
jgi:hypothetical protein